MNVPRNERKIRKGRPLSGLGLKRLMRFIVL